MKKVIFLTFVLSTFVINAQETKEYPQDIDKNYEIKLNAFNLIVFNAIDVSFEKIINQESSYGVSIFYNFYEITGETVVLRFPRNFSTTGFYRWIFSENKVARGFFLEGFGMLNTYEQEIYNYNTGNATSSTENSVNFALGLSVGGKFVLKSGLVTEIYLGIGRNIIKSNNYFDVTLVSRGGFSIGYRF